MYIDHFSTRFSRRLTKHGLTRNFYSSDKRGE